MRNKKTETFECGGLIDARFTVLNYWSNLQTLSYSFPKICAIFTENFFFRNFVQFLRMKCIEFCPIFSQNRKYFLRIFMQILRMIRSEFCAIFFRKLRKTGSITQKILFLLYYNLNYRRNTVKEFFQIFISIFGF